MSILADVLFNKTQQKILSLTYSTPTKSFYTREILNLTGMGVATIKRELDRMIEAGILVKNQIGNQHHYQANPDCPIYNELLSIIQKTCGIADVLRKALAAVQENIVYAFVYGSIAKGTEKTTSDIDLMLVGNGLSYGDVIEQLIPAEKKLNRTINPTIYTIEDFKNKINEEDGFLHRVSEQEKIVITGSMNDVKESGKPGKDRATK